MGKILGIGNALVDILAVFESDDILAKHNLPKGAMTHVDEDLTNKIFDDIKKQSKYDVVAGGSAANTINGLSKLGIESAFIGKVGNDELGDFFVDDVIKNGTTPKIFRSNKTSGNCKVLISPDGERTMCTYLGAALDLADTDLSPELFAGFDYMHVEGYLVYSNNLLRRALELAKSNGVKISLDMASYNVVEENKEFLNEILHNYVDIVFANEDESKTFTGADPEKSLDIFAEICEIAVVKIGARGSLVKRGNESHVIDIIPAKRIDATGAGDLYASGFLYGLSNNLPLEVCGNIGSICSGNIVEVIGPKMNDDRWAKINREISDVLSAVK